MLRSHACLLIFCLLVLGLQTPLSAQKPKPAQPPSDAAQPKEKPDGSAPEPKGKPKPAPPAKKFYEQEPYDLITLDKANNELVLKVLLLQLPERRMPEDPKGKLTVRLFDKRAEEYEVSWRNIAKIDFFEELILVEAKDMVAQAMALSGSNNAKGSQAKFDEAYDFYRYLLTFYPNTTGLKESVQDYLYVNSGALFRRGQVAEAFAILEELYRQNPQYRYPGGSATAQSAMENVGDKLIASYINQDDYRGARMLLERLEKSYGNRLAVIGTWRQKVIELAEKKRDEAKQLLASGKLREAHDASREMLKVWATVDEGRALIEEIAGRYPLVVVGVGRPALEHAPESLIDPAARRTGALMHRTIVRYMERGPEGGLYTSPWGELRQSDDRMQLIFDVRTASSDSRLNGYDLARQLLAISDPDAEFYQPAWASLFTGVDVEEVSQVVVDLRRPSVLPQAYLQTRPASGDATWTRYRAVTLSENETRFEPLPGSSTPDHPLPVIVERYYAEPRKAIDDLRKGKLDMIDGVLPNDAMRLAQDDSLVVGSFAFPSIHVLLPNTENPFLDNRTFRRALLYAVNRKVILEKGLLNQKPLEGCRVLSAALPAGMTADDPSAYAYDEKLAARPYDPVMATILLGLAQQQLAAAAEQREEPAPELQELVLAHPTGEVPRFVCKQIQTQLDVVGVKCTLHELAPGETLPEDGYDLLFMELTMREPLSDVRQLYGSDGQIPTLDPYVNLTLRQIDKGENWKEIRERLKELHRLLYEEAIVLPLWQIVDQFVYHRGLQGVRDRPIFFYDGVDQWRVIPPLPED